MTKDIEKEKYLAAKEAVKLIRDNQIVGLGTGSTAVYAVKEIGNLVKDGLKIQGVPTSNKTKELAETLYIPLIDINEVIAIDITIDGADEFTSDLVLIKGGGGALLKEKIVASMTKEEIIIADSSKKADQLGKFPLPVEVIPFAANYVLRRLSEIEGHGKIRIKDNSTFITDEGNYIIDTDFGVITDPVYLSNYLNNMAGVVAHGLFIKLAKKVIMGISDTNTTVSFE
ncbi:MAG: ribose-5-phosphate isomerase RpiA [Segetibacter sp.]